MPANDTISVYQGEDVDLNFTMNPVEDISGWTIEFRTSGLYSNITKQAAIVNGQSGQFKVSLLAADTSQEPPGEYSYIVWRTDSGSARVIAVGKFSLSDSW